MISNRYETPRQEVYSIIFSSVDHCSFAVEHSFFKKMIDNRTPPESHKIYSIIFSPVDHCILAVENSRYFSKELSITGHRQKLLFNIFWGFF